MIDPVILQADAWFFDVFNDFHAFVTMAVTAAALLGALGGRSMAIGALSAYLVLTKYAVETGDELLTNILIVTLVLIMVGMAFKLWRLEFGGEGGSK